MPAAESDCTASSSARLCHAIVLAGGRGSRLGGIDKAGLRLAGPAEPTLLRRCLEAINGLDLPGATVVVGGHTEDSALNQHRTMVTTCEDPPGSGPLSGLAAGVKALPNRTPPTQTPTSAPAPTPTQTPASIPVPVPAPTPTPDDLVFTLACDLPFLSTAALRALLGALDENPQAELALALDSTGREQYLLAVWRRQALEDRLAEITDLDSQPMRRLINDVPSVRIDLGRNARDLDTWSDVAAYGPLDVSLLARALQAQIAPLTARSQAVIDATGFLAAPLLAIRPFPHSAVSAMDGYATSGPGPWTLTDYPQLAGAAGSPNLECGQAVTIATGALVPPGADRVLRHEVVRIDEKTTVEKTLVETATGAGINDLRPAGEDWAAGAELLPAGHAIDGAVRSVALSAGCSTLLIRGPIRARIITTGEEIIPFSSSEPPPHGKIFDTVGPILPATLNAAGMSASTDIAHCSDSLPALVEMLTSADGTVEVLVAVGATGSGPADFLRPALQHCGAQLLVDGVRMRPGGSQLVAALPGGTLFLGLPGNPLAALCAAAVTGRRIVHALVGLPEESIERAPVDGIAERAATGRARILPARPTASGSWELGPRARTSHLADLLGYPALALIPDSADPATAVELYRWQ